MCMFVWMSLYWRILLENQKFNKILWYKKKTAIKKSDNICFNKFYYRLFLNEGGTLRNLWNCVDIENNNSNIINWDQRKYRNLLWKRQEITGYYCQINGYVENKNCQFINVVKVSSHCVYDWLHCL